jgi:hypothetical protein
VVFLGADLTECREWRADLGLDEDAFNFVDAEQGFDATTKLALSDEYKKSQFELKASLASLVDIKRALSVLEATRLRLSLELERLAPLEEQLRAAKEEGEVRSPLRCITITVTLQHNEHQFLYPRALFSNITTVTLERCNRYCYRYFYRHSNRYSMIGLFNQNHSG